MKTFRIWFLLCLAVLLPVREAVAAAMLCSAGSAIVQSELRGGEHCNQHDMAGSSATQHAGSADVRDGHDPNTSGKCNLCSASCSLTPLVSETPRLPEPVALADVMFAEIPAPAPSFLSDAQDRPPRSI